jgi:hypothetical protein
MTRSFDKIVDEEFGFLRAEFGFRRERSIETRMAFDILFLSNACGVSIVYEFREAYIFVTLHKLAGGKVAVDPSPIGPESLLTSYSLDDVLLVRAPEALVKPVYAYGAESEYYNGTTGLALYVSRFAKNLREFASDVLSGDFSVFSVLEPIVKKRAERPEMLAPAPKS